MTKRMKESIVVFVLIAVVGYVFLNFYRENEKQKEFEASINKEIVNDEGEKMKYGSEVGDMVYDYKMTEISTEKEIKISDYRGKKIFLNFWASWCPPCKQEAPELQKFAENQDDAIILGVNVTDAEKHPGKERDFIKDYGLTFPNVYVQNEIFSEFFIGSFPTSFIINENGVIEEKIVGAVTEDFLKEKLMSK